MSRGRCEVIGWGGCTHELFAGQMALLTSVRQSRLVRTLVRRVGVHRVVAAAHLVQAPLQVVVSSLVRRVPRDQRLVALGSPLDRFADNAAYLFLHLSTHRHDDEHALQPVWVSGSRDVVRRLRSQGHRATTRWSPHGVWTALRAGTFVYSGYRSDVNRWLSPGARTFCLWHGLPIKRVEGAVGKPQGQRGWLRRLQQVAREPAPDHLLTPSDFVAERFSPAFGVPKERCWRLGYPRNDHLLDDPDAPPGELVWHTESWNRLREADPVVGLFLTWRDDRVDDVVGDDLLAELASCAVRAGGVLAYKAHYNVSPSSAPDTEYVRLPADVDLHAYLGLCDVLVTDYSSVALDFLLTGRPVVYFMPDLEDYAATRGFHVDPLSLPGVVTRDRAALVGALERELRDGRQRPPSPARAELLDRLWGPSPSRASARIASLLARLAEGGSVSAAHVAGPDATPRRASG